MTALVAIIAAATAAFLTAAAFAVITGRRDRDLRAALADLRAEIAHLRRGVYPRPGPPWPPAPPRPPMMRAAAPLDRPIP